MARARIGGGAPAPAAGGRAAPPVRTAIHKSGARKGAAMEGPMHVEQKYVAKGAIEWREYQVALAEKAREENCIIVLPTGLGKTAVALQVIASFMEKGEGGALFLAPTRVLANQHYGFLRDNLTVSDVSLITGEDPVRKRKAKWAGSSVVCATPEIAKNDLDRQLVSPSQFSLVIFDEAHRTVGDYAYSGIAERTAPAGARIVGMTATLPSEREKAESVMKTLRARSIQQRTEESEDVRPYIQVTKTEWIEVDLPPEMKAIQALLKLALNERYAQMGKCGVAMGQQRSLSALLRVRPFVLGSRRAAAKPLFTAIRITYALNILEAHGVSPFLAFCERTAKKKGAGIKELFEIDANFTRAMRLAEEARAKGVEHSKIPKLEEIIRKGGGRALVFSSYRDSVGLIRDRLEAAGVSAGILIGKAGETGLKQKKQVEAVEKFRGGEYQVLVATRVGEEGLDVSEVNLVVFYDNVPSSIRYVQRKGRTGRRSAGRLVVLIAKGTIDEAYYWIGRRKITAARGMGARMNRALQESGAGPRGSQPKAKAPGGLDDYF